jgi:hypothetical protein
MRDFALQLGADRWGVVVGLQDEVLEVAYHVEEKHMYLALTVHNYHPPATDDHAHDLKLHVGDVVEVLDECVDELGPGWGLGRLHEEASKTPGATGFFPISYTTRGSWGWPGWPGGKKDDGSQAATRIQARFRGNKGRRLADDIKVGQESKNFQGRELPVEWLKQWDEEKEKEQKEKEVRAAEGPVAAVGSAEGTQEIGVSKSCVIC